MVDEVSLATLREPCRNLVKALQAQGSPLPADTVKELEKLLATKGKEEDAAVRKLQELLDAHCLIGVTINPESRVKAVRGPAGAALQLGKTRALLIKVQNDAGVTAALKVSGPQLRDKGKMEGKWLEAAICTDPPLAKKLTGGKLDYVVLLLTPHEAGKREATLQFDVEQGTQDLGFRAEVPVLFTIRD